MSFTGVRITHSEYPLWLYTGSIVMAFIKSLLHPIILAPLFILYIYSAVLPSMYFSPGIYVYDTAFYMDKYDVSLKINAL